MIKDNYNNPTSKSSSDIPETIWTTQSHCLNCGTELTDKYCPYCGQSTKIKRLSFKTMISNILYDITNINRGFIYTIIQLFINPGKVVTDYINGRRVNYSGPFSLFVISCTIYGLTSWIVFSIQNVENPIQGTMPIWMKSIQLPESIGKWLQSNKILLWTLVYLPLRAYITKFVFRRKRYYNYNFTEITYLCLFIICQNMIIGTLTIIVTSPIFGVSMITASYIQKVVLIVSLLLFLPTWYFRGVFKISWLLAFWKSIQILLYTTIIQSIIDNSINILLNHNTFEL